MSALIDILAQLQQAHRTGRTAGVTELRAQVPGPILAHFDRQLAQGRAGLAEVSNGICRACHLRLPAAVVTSVAGDIEVCENCGAYLKLLPPEAAPAMRARSVRAVVRRRGAVAVA
jgi:predicted  nucleic acid-binding Zn-ribbon protein